MRNGIAVLLLTLSIVMTFGADASGSASSMRRELRRIVGFTVVASDSVSDVIERRGQKYVELISGASFKVDGLLLDPLVATDVVIFAKSFSASPRLQYPNLPERHYYSYKLLIDDEFFDATAF